MAPAANYAPAPEDKEAREENAVARSSAASHSPLYPQDHLSMNTVNQPQLCRRDACVSALKRHPRTLFLTPNPYSLYLILTSHEAGRSSTQLLEPVCKKAHLPLAAHASALPDAT